jgi:uncharacterized repeat protein (TIGR02543 family)
MKKVLMLLLIATLALLVLTACDGLVPSEGEGETEGEGEFTSEGITVAIEGAVDVDGKTYLSRGEHAITVTFHAPVAGVVQGTITYCSGYYGKGPEPTGTDIVFFPNPDRTVWTGSGAFQDSQSLCCASYVQITSGECSDEVCIRKPVIVDSEAPYANLEVCLNDCTCAGCTLSFDSISSSAPCSEDTSDCGDSCSGLANWAIALYTDYPYDQCCETPCAEPVATCSGTDCPIECTTDCLTEGTYYAIVTLSDQVDNEVRFGSQIDWEPEACDTLIVTDLAFQLDPSGCLDNPANCGFVPCSEKAGYRLVVVPSPLGGGTATDQTGAGVYMPGDAVTISATPATGYTFENWSAPAGTLANASSVPTTFTMPAEDVNVTANFKLIDYTVSLSVSPTDSGTVTGDGTYHYGDPVALTASPNSDYVFVNWTDDNDSDAVISTDNPFTFTMPPVDVNYTANFEEVLFAEAFTQCAFGTIADWSTTHSANWYAVNSNQAGGSAPEMRFDWSPIFENTSRLISPFINASGINDLMLSFKHHVDDFENSYTLKVQVSTDGGTSWMDSGWSISPSGDIGPETVTVDLSAYDGLIFQIAWVFEGDSYDINYWYIDDIVVD